MDKTLYACLVIGSGYVVLNQNSIEFCAGIAEATLFPSGKFAEDAVQDYDLDGYTFVPVKVLCCSSEQQGVASDAFCLQLSLTTPQGRHVLYEKSLPTDSTLQQITCSSASAALALVCGGV